MTSTRNPYAQRRIIAIADVRASRPGSPATTTAGIKAQPLAPGSVPSRHAAAANDTTAYNPCLSCGACCAHFRVSFYCGEIAGESGGTVPPELVTQVSALRGCMKGTEHGGKPCVALRGEVGQDGVHCGIYEQRPSPCREFPTWLAERSPNPDCQSFRKAIGLPLLPPRPGDDDIHPGNTPPRRGDVAA